jgi:hypothetical protein
MQISVKADIKELTRKLNRIQKKQIPFATAQALTWTAQDVRTDLYRNMKKVFDNPTKFIVPGNIEKPGKKGALFMTGAKKNNLVAKVWVKDLIGDKGPPAINILGPNIYGGKRKDKGSERALKSRGLIPAGKQIAPARGLNKNRHGNVTAGTMTKILSGLSALPGAAKGSKSRQKVSYFVMRLGGPGSDTGIFERRGKKIKKLFNVVSPPNYKRRFHFSKVAANSNKRHFKRNFDKSLKKALATAR